MGFNCPKATEPLPGDSLIFTTKSPGDPGTHLIDLGRMKKAELTLKPPSCFDPGTLALGIQSHNHLAIAPYKLCSPCILSTNFSGLFRFQLY